MVEVPVSRDGRIDDAGHGKHRDRPNIAFFLNEWGLF
jgi:hypothetical protein